MKAINDQQGRLLWKVMFDSVFQSSSGMDRYAIQNFGEVAYLCTDGNSLADVEAVLVRNFDNQTSMQRMISAEYLGKVIS